MLVKNWMSKKVFTVNMNQSMADAMNLMKENDIRMLPVMDKNGLVGIVTDGDIKRASASNATTLEMHELLYLISKIKVKDIMTKKPITVFEDLTVEETAEILLENKISGLPVVNKQNQLVGVITQDDIFRVLIALTGIKKRGIQFAFKLEDKPGSIKELADIIRIFGGRMVSILSTYEGTEEGYRKVYIRMYNIDREKMDHLRGELQKIGTLLYMVDLKENRREIFTS